MNATPSDPIRKILIAFDPYLPPERLVDFSLALTQSYQSQIEGIFLRDVNLLRMAALPFTQLVGTASGDILPLEADAIEKMLDKLSEQARQALVSRSRMRGISASFSVRTTAPGNFVREAAAASLLVVIAKSGPSSAMPVVAGAYLNLPHGQFPPGPIMVLYSDLDLVSDHLLRLARALGREIALVVHGDEEKARAEEWTSRQPLDVSVRILPVAA